jgi:ATP-dependent Lon protease
LLVGRAASLAAVEAARTAHDGRILLVAQRRGEVAEPAPRDLYRTGTIARVLQDTPLPNGSRKLLVEGLGRAGIRRFRSRAGVRHAEAVPMREAAPAGRDLEAKGRRALALFEEYVGLHGRLPAEVLPLVQATPPGEPQAFAIAAHVAAPLDRRQRLLEAPTIEALWTAIMELLVAELELLRLERKIDDQVRGTLVRSQREYWLQEQLKAIQRELGQEDGDDVDQLAEQVAARGLPEVARQRAEREVARLRKMSPLAPEAAVSRHWLEWVLALPWHERSTDTLDLAKAQAQLDADHFGLADVKDRILDHLAVLHAVGTARAPVLCLAGPPGVGKTSLGRSIAAALGRQFVRMSLGGVRDEAEIRGHRRTYIGALPGRILQGMRRAGTVNPVLLLDEIDKLGQDVRGDPAAALLEVLDPEQHAAFQDHYLELDYDLSQVLFLTTANTLQGIPGPLRDRMEIIRIPGYVESEKLAIARDFLWPKQVAAHGLPRRARLDAQVLPQVVRRWTREAGVRELDRRLARLARKLARRRAASPSAPLVVRADALPELLGPPPFEATPPERGARVGVANGLAYTGVGGEVLEIEVSALPGRGRLQLTGALGDVMKESATAALTYVRARTEALGLPPGFHRTTDLHIHVPDGATPKDGPSAGIAMATAIVSALSGIAVRGDVAMTGEVTLRGRVLPIGGLKEKASGAHREGLRTLLIPKGNAHEIAELPEDMRTALTLHVVSSMDEVLALALASPPRVEAEGSRPRRTTRSGRPTGPSAEAH